jgi:hypothetical protein
LFSWLLFFYLTVIITEYIDDNKDNFIDIDDFDSEEERADLNYPEDDDSDLIILLFNNPLRTILKEDKEEDRPIYSLQ